MSIHRGSLNDDEPYLRSVVFQQWLFGYELPDTIVLIREDGHIWICATKKKCEEQGGGSDTVPEWKRKLLEMKKKKLQELESIKANAQGEKAEPVEVSASTQAPEIREAEHTFVTQDPFDPVQDPHSGDVVHSLSSGDVKVLEKAIQAEIIES